MSWLNPWSSLCPESRPIFTSSSAFLQLMNSFVLLRGKNGLSDSIQLVHFKPGSYFLCMRMQYEFRRQFGQLITRSWIVFNSCKVFYANTAMWHKNLLRIRRKYEPGFRLKWWNHCFSDVIESLNHLLYSFLFPMKFWDNFDSRK